MPKTTSIPESFMTIRSARNSLPHITIGDWVDQGGRGNISVLSHECLEQIGNSLEGNLTEQFRRESKARVQANSVYSDNYRCFFLYMILIVFICCRIKINLALIPTKPCHALLPKYRVRVRDDGQQIDTKRKISFVDTLRCS